MRFAILLLLLSVSLANAQQPAPLGPLVQSAAKAEVPSEEAQKTALREIAEVYKADYDKAKTATQKIELANKLLREAVATKDDVVGRYVLLRVSRDIAAAQGDLGVALQATQQICREYEADLPTMQIEVANIAVKAPKLAKGHLTVAGQLLPLIDAAIAADHYERAVSIAELALQCARSAEDAEKIKQFDALRNEIDAIAAEFQEIQTAKATLEQKPTDAAANLSMGKFLCFSKGDWGTGVSMLALGDDEELKAAALLELAAKPDALKIAEAWWTVSENQTGKAKEKAQAHTAHWYQVALPALTGLTKAKVETRMKSLPTPVAPTVTSSKVAGTPVTSAVNSPAGDFGFSDTWVNDTYKTIIRKRGKNWIETQQGTGKAHLSYTELARNEKYVELFCIERKHKMRLLKSGRAEFDGKGRWEWISNGHWEPK
jgi:hypothetical protein